MSNIVSAYQTLEYRDEDGNIDFVEMEGPFECRRRDAWLGYGYYLWDSNIDWAHSWGKSSYKNKGKDYLIGTCKVDLSTCFDLVGSVHNRMEMEEVIDTMVASGMLKDKDNVIIPNLIMFMKKNNMFPYKSIRAQDIPKNVKRLKFNASRKEYTFINQRVQICVIDKKEVLLSSFSVIYPEKSLT